MANSPERRCPQRAVFAALVCERTELTGSTGAAWIGLWKNDGIIELNVTVVVNENHEPEAIQMGDRWDQKAVYHLGRSKTIPTGGTGWQSIYTDKQATDEPDTGLRSRLRRWATKQQKPSPVPDQ